MNLGRPIIQKGNFRSELMKRLVREMDCVECHNSAPSVAAHPNLIELGKGTGEKASDFVFPLCHECHHELDNGNRYSKAERRALTWEYIAKTLIKLILRGKLILCA